MIQLTSAELMALPRKNRIRLHNSLLGAKPAQLVGTASADGVPNLAVFNSVCHVSSTPALIGMMSRPLVVRRDTHDNIHATGQWTLNAITAGFVDRAHRAADKLPAGESEFDHTGLQPLFLEGFRAPAVAESPVQIGLQFREEVAIPSSGTVFIIGEVEWLRVLPEGLSDDGSLKPDCLNMLSSLGLDGYACVEEVARFAYESDSLD